MISNQFFVSFIFKSSLDKDSARETNKLENMLEKGLSMLQSWQ